MEPGLSSAFFPLILSLSKDAAARPSGAPAIGERRSWHNALSLNSSNRGLNRLEDTCAVRHRGLYAQMDKLQAFERLLYESLIPEFCADPRRRCTLEGFRNDSVKVSETDACDFLRAWDAGLLTHRGRGLYRAAVSSASEQFFWQGPKVSELRWFSLWLEPVITVAALARLHFDHGWPINLLGTQSINWAFDVVALRQHGSNELIAGEVKKTAKEVEVLLSLMARFGDNPGSPCPAGGKARNAFKKVAALRSGRAPLFWAVGPDRLSRVFRVTYLNEIVRLAAVEEAELDYSRSVRDS